ncbi:MAG TPA: ferredoxin [Burkholderiales bacterium]|nr:ferredoxin [Burkholderiales bacterium]
MYVILTSKPGQFRTEAGEGLKPVEAYDYLFCGRKRAQFVIAQIEGEPKVKIVDEASPAAVNFVPSKFLPRFDSLEKARRELETLAGLGGLDVSLERI